MKKDENRRADQLSLWGSHSKFNVVRAKRSKAISKRPRCVLSREFYLRFPPPPPFPLYHLTCMYAYILYLYKTK